MAFDPSPRPENLGLLDAGPPRPIEDGGLKIPPVKSVEILSLTSVRGVAAIWVVLLHFSVLLFGIMPEASVLRPLIDAGYFAVPLFFILSGYVLGIRYLARLGSPTVRAVLRFWLLRLGRVYPVHLFTLLVSVGMVSRHGWPTGPGHHVERLIANILLIHAWDYSFHLSWNYPSWSISSEWFAYLLFPLLAVALFRVGRAWAAALLVAACGLSACTYAFRQDLAFQGLAVVLPTFVGGVLLAILIPPGCPSERSHPWAEAESVALLSLPFVVDSGPAQSSLYLLLFFALVGSLGSQGNRSRNLWRSRPLVFLGEISYSLYMIHAIAITLMARFFPLDALRGMPLPVRLGAVLGGLAMILGSSVAVYYSLELPLRGLSRRLGASSCWAETRVR